MEIWADINGYEGLYQVSNLGRIKSLARYQDNHGTKQWIEERIKNARSKSSGYLVVDLYKNGVGKTKHVHRLVAENFIENKENKATVNHIDGNKSNNVANNLEWATPSEQNKHYYRNGLKSKKSIKKAVKAMNIANSKPLIDIVSGFYYESISNACKALKCCSGTIKKNKDRFIFI